MAIGGVAGCYSVDDVRGGPIVWTANYNVPFDTMANCLAVQYGREYSVVPSLFQSERRATVTLNMPAGAAVVAEFQIRETTSGTQVSWQHVGSTDGAQRSVDRQARERADRCGTPA